jgi:hypothetical protein
LFQTKIGCITNLHRYAKHTFFFQFLSKNREKSSIVSTLRRFTILTISHEYFTLNCSTYPKLALPCKFVIHPKNLRLAPSIFDIQTLAIRHRHIHCRFRCSNAMSVEGFFDVFLKIKIGIPVVFAFAPRAHGELCDAYLQFIHKNIHARIF